MKQFVFVILLPFLFCAAQKREANIFDASALEPRELYTSLSPEQQEFLQKNGFFAQRSPHRKFSELYKYLRNSQYRSM